MEPRTIAWMEDLLAATGGTPDLVLHPVVEGNPRFDFGALTPSPVALGAASWAGELRQALSPEASWSRALIYPMAFPERSEELVWEAEEDADETRRFHGEAAFLAAALSAAPPGRLVSSLVSAALLVHGSAARFREWLARAHAPEWIVYLGPSAARAMGVDGLSMVFLAVRAGGGEKKGLVRLADLREVDRGSWGERLEAVRTSRGGESEHGIVTGVARLGGEAWTYESFTRSFREQTQDTRELGAMRRLSELAEVRRGMSLKALSALHADAEAGDGETLPCYRSRNLSGRQGERPYFVRRDGVEEGEVLAAGDVLVHLTANPSISERPVAVVELGAGAVPAVCERPVLVVSFHADVDPEVRQLIVGFLRSGRMRDQLTAKGVTGSLSAELLSRLEVPYPREDVRAAFAQLGELESRYQGWAEAARRSRQELFDASSYAETIPRLLERVREERERVQAAEASQRLDYKVRNAYPRPIALRWEHISQVPPGEARVKSILECAEHLLAFVAWLSMIQVSENHDIGWKPSSIVRGLAKGGLYVDWGKMQALVLQGAVAAAKDPDRLRLPFPELGNLAGTHLPWQRAEEGLHGLRNDLSHLQRYSRLRLEQLSEEMTEHFNELLAAFSFIATCPLVHVHDYALDPVTGGRRVELAYHEGVGVALRRSWHPIDFEVGRGAVGVVDHHGVFRCLSPWVVHETCPECHTEQIFVFNRFKEGKVTYVEMAAGHPLDKTEWAPAWRRLVEESEAVKADEGES